MAIGFIQIPVLAASGLTTADEKTGLRVPLTEGKIRLQCDGAEGYFQDVMIESIDHLPQVQVAHWAIEVSDLGRIWLRQRQTYMIADALDYLDRNGLLEEVPEGDWEDEMIAIQQAAARQIARVRV